MNLSFYFEADVNLFTFDYNLFTYDNLSPPFRFARPSERKAPKCYVSSFFVSILQIHALVCIIDDTSFCGIAARMPTSILLCSIFIYIYLCLLVVFISVPYSVFHSETKNHRDSASWLFESIS